MPKKDLVLGAVHAMELEYIAPFLLSLKRTGYEGDIAFFVSNLSERTLRWLEANGVTTVSIDGANPMPGLPVNSLRYYVYHPFLQQNAGAYNRVFLSDVRDVFFQRSPFDTDMGAALCCFEEHPGWNLAKSPVNCGWVAAAFGKKTIEQLGHHRILCSGTTLGTESAMRAYVSTMVDTLTKVNTDIPSLLYVTGGIDQGIHNYLVRTGAFDDVYCYGNGEGIVWTLNYENEDDLPVSEDGTILNRHGEVAHVLHQYDRHTKLTQHVVSLLESKHAARQSP